MISFLLQTIKQRLVPGTFAAQNTWQDQTGNNPAVFEDLEYVVDKGLEALFALGGLVAFTYLIIGGFKYLTAGGDEKATMFAKQTLTWAIIGLLIIVSSFLILKTLGDPEFLNLPTILEFEIPK